MEKIKKERHLKCKGFETLDTGWGSEFDCGYNTKLSCDECKYGGGTKNPNAKSNKLDDTT